MNKVKVKLIKLHTKIIYNKSNLEINKARFMWVGMRHDIQKCFPFFSIGANDLVMRQRRQTVCQVWNCCYLSQCRRTSAHRLESNTLLSIDCETKGNKTGMKYQKKLKPAGSFKIGSLWERFIAVNDGWQCEPTNGLTSGWKQCSVVVTL